MWRWADPQGQQRRVRLDELRAALAGGVIAPNTPVWKPGWREWQPAHEVPELASTSIASANGVVMNIPPPPLAVVAVQKEFEAKAGARPPSMYEEPPPPPRYVPAPPKSGSLAPPPPAVAPHEADESGSNRAIATVGAGSKRSVPPPKGVSLPTAIGLPPPPELAGLAAAAKAGKMPAPPPKPANNDDSVEELSGSMLLDESKDAILPAPFGGPPAAPYVSPALGEPLGEPIEPPTEPRDVTNGLPPPTDPVLNDSGERDALGDSVPPPPIRKPSVSLIISDLKEIRAGRPPKNKLLIGVLGFLTLMGLILIIALIASTCGGSSDSKKTIASASASASAPPPPVETGTAASAAPSSTSTAAVPPAEPAKTTSVELGDCNVSGEGCVIAPRALIATGVEAVAGQTALAIGFAPSLHDAVGVSLDPGSLTPTATVRARAPGDIRRVVPFFSGGKIVIVPDADKKGDRLTSRRFVPTSNPVDVGVADNQIVWAPHGKDSFAKLFALDGDAAVESLRVIPLPSGKGIALAFRRGAAIFVGVATGDAVLNAEGELSKISSLGQAGSPTLAASGDSIVVAWADRATKDDQWGIRWTKRSISGAVNEPRALSVPDGGLGGPAMSPSVAGLGRGKFLLSWTEGPTAGHQVRALTFNADGAPSGSPLAISASGVNAGQPQAVVGVDGRGVVAFLAAKGKFNELMATPILCPAR
jgi:hypothetical protein